MHTAAGWTLMRNVLKEPKRIVSSLDSFRVSCV